MFVHPSGGDTIALVDGCTFVAALACLLIVLTAVYVLLISVTISVALSRIPHDALAARIPFSLPWRRTHHIPDSLERACPVRDHNAPETRCAVCLDPMRTGDPVRTLPCQHAFHRGCIDAWICKGANRCPLCNARILPLSRDNPDLNTDLSLNSGDNHEEHPAIAAANAAANAAAAVANAVQDVDENVDQGRPPRRFRFWPRFRRRR